MAISGGLMPRDDALHDYVRHLEVGKGGSELDTLNLNRVISDGIMVSGGGGDNSSSEHSKAYGSNETDC